ncbi:hypothetical protein M6B38_205140 [Iris pallida]|uniref:Uncharacterized protein n=1 Tax=Iris pallida TaxID=29817 RepID=A0AAX6E7Y2_IRIPA|nr:hypothetical protein M6B38_205140 [Iris pallida]
MEKTDKGTSYRERHTSRSTNLPRRTSICTKPSYR